MSLEKPVMLVVEDNVGMQHLLRRVFEREGYRVLSAGNGEAALDVFDQENPDLVLLDVKMRGMDGYTVCRRIRELSQVPIIMVTAKDSEEEKIKGLDAGADDYVTKPFSYGELVARVRAVLRRTKT